LVRETAGGYTHGKGNNAGSSGKAVDMFDRQGRRVATAQLSISRGTMGAATWKDLAFFGGGQDAEKNNTAVVDIFNVTDGSHSIEHLSQPRSMVAAASVGDLVLFAGGELAEDESGQGPSRESKRVDVWNARLKKWVASDDSLSVARKKTAAAVAAGKVIFAGGYAESSHQSVATWDMYDLATNKWSSGSLSSKRMRLQAVSLVANDGTEFALFIGGLGEFQQEGGIESCPHTWEATKSGPQCVYTTGGLCTTVDIYNGRTGEWSFTNLTRGRYEFAVRNGHFWSVLNLKMTVLPRQARVGPTSGKLTKGYLFELAGGCGRESKPGRGHHHRWKAGRDRSAGAKQPSLSFLMKPQ
jgi:hypothetical protein